LSDEGTNEVRERGPQPAGLRHRAMRPESGRSQPRFGVHGPFPSTCDVGDASCAYDDTDVSVSPEQTPMCTGDTVRNPEWTENRNYNYWTDSVHAGDCKLYRFSRLGALVRVLFVMEPRISVGPDSEGQPS
jgi:hypothetical protein